jgi:DNA repair/transcription protein MET18/MMS19
VTKGLLVKGHSLSMPFRDALFEAAKDEVIGRTAAKAIGEIVAADGVLTRKNHAIVKVRFVKILWITNLLLSVLICAEVRQSSASPNCSERAGLGR